MWFVSIEVKQCKLWALVIAPRGFDCYVTCMGWSKPNPLINSEFFTGATAPVACIIVTPLSEDNLQSSLRRLLVVGGSLREGDRPAQQLDGTQITHIERTTAAAALPSRWLGSNHIHTYLL